MTTSCMFVSGVPGTGKTATVTSAVACLRAEARSAVVSTLPPFRTASVNAMHVTEPRRVYELLLRAITGRSASLHGALAALEHELVRAGALATVVVLDEVDQLCNRRLDVLYTVFDWLQRRHCRLVLVTISNTMDLAERVLSGKVASRLGVTRLAFEPYSPQQLVSIISSRLSRDGAQLLALFDVGDLVVSVCLCVAIGYRCWLYSVTTARYLLDIFQ